VFRARESHVAAAAALGVALLLVEAAHSLGADVILVSMVCGFVVRNASGDRCENLFNMLRQFSLPVMVVFFVLVGAQLQVSAVPPWLIGLVAVYVLARSAGKVAGAYLGGWASRSAASVRRYAGMGLFTQGAVAVGLSIMAVHRLGEQPAASGLRLGEVIIFCATATTLVVEIIGPPLVKLAAGLAGEIGRNVTEEDVILSWSVADVTDTDLVTVREGDSLQRVFGLFSTHDYLLIPVVGAAGELIGIVSMSVLKHILADHQMWEWLLVSDVMEPAEHTARPSQRLEDALKQMDLMALEQMPVVQEADGARPVGVLSLARVRRLVRQEALRRQQPAEPPRPAPAGAGAEGPPTPRPR
jgi:CBS domain-containing protein